MKRLTRRQSGMTLIEMLAAVSVMVILTAILAEVFLAASKAAAQGKSLAEIYQVDRALRSLMARDLSGATADFFESRENGLIGVNSRLFGLPPGPYYYAMQSLVPPPSPAGMDRMLMGGSDYLAFTSGSASLRDKAVAKVYYVLREGGQLIRVTNEGFSTSDFMDYTYDAVEHPPSGIGFLDPASDDDMDRYEVTRVIAENVERVKFSFFDRGKESVGATAPAYANGVWLDDWDWNKGYLPAAVKVELQLVDHLWNLSDGNKLSNKDFNPNPPLPALPPGDDLRASEMFDPDDGEAFTFIIDVPLGTK